MSIYNRTYAVGDIVTYNTFGGGYRTVVVTEKHEDVKNGRPGFDGRALDSEDGISRFWGYDSEDGISRFWGYDDQIVSVTLAGSL